jgi:outer membrane receptor protein involved in Fe transport
VRFDHHRLVVRATHLSPRVNVSIQAGRGTAVHASYNRLFVPPPIEGVLSSSAGLTQMIREIDVALPALEPTIEDQLEVGVTSGWRALQLGLTAYHRESDNPVHTTVWPDSRIYSYASFDRGRAYGLELRAATPPRDGWSGYLNYALGRVYFFNPVTGGFVTEAAHIDDSSRFLAPMDQTHTATGGVTYRHARSGFWMGLAAEYGSGTPTGHGTSHEHAEGADDHDDGESATLGLRVPDHLTANVSLGFTLLRDAVNRARLAVQMNIENVTDDVYLVATEGPFSPRQYATPRVASVTAIVKF